MPRRCSYEPLQRSAHPRWLVVRDMHRSVIEHRLLPADTDLYGVFIKALAAHVDDGWQLEVFSSSHACAFCARRNERRVITVESEDPNRPLPSRRYAFSKVI